MPYITASIITQLLTVVIPHFEELKKEGQSGQTKMTQYTRYLTLALALLQSAGIVALADREQLLGQGIAVLAPDRTIWDLIILVVVMTSGAILVMWIGELITEKGVGNGMSLLIFAGIATRLPTDGMNILQTSGGVVFAVVVAAVIALVVGGGLSNLIDRLLNEGRVVDFMQLGIGPLRTGVFNVADVAIMGGLAVMLVVVFRDGKTAK